MLVREDKLCVAMEFCSGGSLATILAKFGTLDDVVARRYTSQILSGLEYLHRHCIVHRDIKCPNCLLGTDGVVKLADFGASKKLHALCTSSLQGTAQYIAPEILKRERVGRQSDIWSVGCCVLEMYTLSLPFSGQFSNDFSLMYTMANMKEPPNVPTDIPADAQSFIRECFALCPLKRPSAVRLRKHDFFVNFVDDVRIQPGVRRQDLEAAERAAAAAAAAAAAYGGAAPAEDPDPDAARGPAGTPRPPSSIQSAGAPGANLGPDTPTAAAGGARPRSEADGPLAWGAEGGAGHAALSFPGTQGRAAASGGPRLLPGPPSGSHHSAPGPDLAPAWPDGAPSHRRPVAAATAAAGPPGGSRWGGGAGERAGLHHRAGRPRRDSSGSSGDSDSLREGDGDSASEGSSLSDLDSAAARPGRLVRDRLLLGSRFADAQAEAQYRAKWMRETVQAVRGSWAWAALLLVGGAVDLHTAWTLGPPAVAAAVTAVWGLIAAGQAGVRLLVGAAGPDGGPGAFRLAMAWVRTVELLNLGLVCAHSAGGDVVAVMRIVLLTYTGGHLKASLGEHVLLLGLFAGARLLQVALAFAVRPGAPGAGALPQAPARRDESLTSTVMLQTVSAFASVFYAMRSHEEARSRFAVAPPG